MFPEMLLGGFLGQMAHQPKTNHKRRRDKRDSTEGSGGEGIGSL